MLNPFHATGLFLYPLKTPGNLWFSGFLKKETGGMKWVKWCYIDFQKDCFKNNSKLAESKSAGMSLY